MVMASGLPSWVSRNGTPSPSRPSSGSTGYRRPPAAWSHATAAVIGEGWVGYTPLLAEFEDGPVGQGLAEHAVRCCIEHGYWGAVLGSNSAPHHPGWRNVEWQRRCNDRLRAG